jgi:hypothetical protein
MVLTFPSLTPHVDRFVGVVGLNDVPWVISLLNPPLKEPFPFSIELFHG